jgi:hypothetical protein
LGVFVFGATQPPQPGKGDMSNLAKRKRYSAAKAAIEASLQIALEQAQAILHSMQTQENDLGYTNPSHDDHGGCVPASSRQGDRIQAHTVTAQVMTKWI